MDHVIEWMVEFWRKSLWLTRLRWEAEKWPAIAPGAGIVRPAYTRVLYVPQLAVNGDFFPIRENECILMNT